MSVTFRPPSLLVTPPPSCASEILQRSLDRAAAIPASITPRPLQDLHPQGLLGRHATPLTTLRCPRTRAWVSAPKGRCSPAVSITGPRQALMGAREAGRKAYRPGISVLSSGLHASAESGQSVVSQLLSIPLRLELNFHRMSEVRAEPRIRLTTFQILPLPFPGLKTVAKLPTLSPGFYNCLGLCL